jgi:hypothetical protein
MRHGGIHAFLILIATWMALPELVFADEAAEERWEHKLCELGDLKERLANPPSREPKIEKPAEPYKLSLKNVGPQWIAQKYVAIVRVEFPEADTIPNYRRDTSATRHTVNPASEPQLSQILQNDQELTLLQSLPDGRAIIAPKYGVPFGEIRASNFKRLVKNTPENRRPGQAEIDYFVGDTPFTWSFSHQKTDYGEFLIAAPTAELAERRARALLTLLDQGFSRTLQLALYEKLGEQCKYLKEVQEKVDENTSNVQQVAKELQHYAGFNTEMLAPLRLQQLQLEIDLAGVKARIAGCDTLQKETEGNAERWNQIQALKTAAKIEMLAIEARQAKAAEFLTKVKEANQHASKQAQAKAQLQASFNNYRHTANQIAKIHEEIRWFAPLPLVDDKIIVQPLEFTQ